MDVVGSMPRADDGTQAVLRDRRDGGHENVVSREKATKCDSVNGQMMW